MPPWRGEDRGRVRRTGIPADAAALLVLSACPVWAQAPGKEIRAVRSEGRAPVVDGRLAEEAWAGAPVVTAFLQRQPVEDAPAGERTEVRFLYDDQALYVGARMFSRDPARIRSPLSRRDNATQAEYLLVSLDTYLDRRTAYTFGVTAAGTRLDWYHPSDDEDDTDSSFDPVWQAEVHHDSLGWTAEMRIPFSQLRFVTHPESRWGVNVMRRNPVTQEESYWMLVPTTGTGWASHFGILAGIGAIRATRRVEVTPYVAGDANFTADPGTGNPFDDGSRLSARLGGDVKMGLGSNLTVEGTVNPDFGQVEADPAEVNLTAYETSFSEKRPFFIEGSQLFAAGGAEAGGERQYFYSRRIGAAARDEVVDALIEERIGGYTYLDRPRLSTILGAAKLTGRLPSGLSLGALAAVTDEEHARTFGEDVGDFGRVRVAPRTGYAVLRAQQEFGGSGSTAGVSLVGLHRDLAAGEPLAALLHRTAYSGGADWNLRFRGGEYRVQGTLGFSHVAGDSLAILRAQLSSARYFQRPDAPPARLDPSRTSLSGIASSLGVSRDAGSHWLWSVNASTISPGLELNDAGFQNVADELWGQADLRYRETRPRGIFRNYQLLAATENQWNFEGVNTYRALKGEARATLRSYWRTVLLAYLVSPALSNDLTRGGPLMRTARGWTSILLLQSPPAAVTGFTGRLDVGASEDGRELMMVSGGVTVHPSPRWEVSASPTYYRETNPRQYVGVLPGGTAATFGRRYLFSFIDQTTVSTQLRLNYTLTPDLSLEVYAEPFAASGRFYDFGELAAARSGHLRTYGTDGTTIRQAGEQGPYTVTDGSSAFTLPFRDFNVRSFRSNAVLRWEWRPGSTLFVVWQQDRFASEGVGSRVGLGDLARSVEEAGDNFLVLKATYWIQVR
jgi:hypothetical protein